MEQLESRQMLSVAASSTPSTSSAHALHLAHVKHVNHLRHMTAATGKSAATIIKRSTVTVSSSSAPAVASSPVGAPPAPAFTTIQPDATNTNLAFEAESGYITDNDGDGRTWLVKTGAAANGNATTASGGAAIYADRPSGSGLVTYHLHFNAPGIYKLYARDKFTGGGDNSMFVPPGTVAAPGNISAAPSQTYSNDAANPLNDGRVYGDYAWDLSVNTAAYNVTAAGDATLTFNMRENGYYVDRIVLSTNTALAASDLDALTNTATTLGAPQTLTATPGGKSVLVSWQTVPGATSYNVSRGSVAGGPYTNIASNVTGGSYSDNNLANGSYFYVVTANNSSGTSTTQSPEATATVNGVLAGPTKVRQVPGTDQVALSWTPAIGATSYTVKRATSLSGAYAPVTGGTGLTGSSFTDTTVTPGTQYYYIVTATDGTQSADSVATPGATVSTANQGFSSAFYTSTNGANPRIYSSATSKFGYYTTVPQINFRGGGDDTAPPDAPATWNNGSRKGDNFDAHWEGVFKVPYTDDYTFFAGSDDGIRVTVDGVILAPDNINSDRGYTDDTHAPAVHLVAGQYAVVEVDYNQGGGGWDATFGLKGNDPNNPVIGTTEAIAPQSLFYIPQPKQVTNVTGTGNAGAVQLSWNRGNVETDSYNIYSSPTGLPGSFTLAGTAPGSATSFSKSGFANGTPSYFMVSAVNASGEGLLTAPVAITPQASLTAPANVKEFSRTDSVVLSWDPVLGATGYNVKRGTSINGPFTLVTGGAVTGTTFTDTTVTPGTQYYYSITATAAGVPESPASITLPAKTLSTTHAWSAAFYYSSDGNNPRIYSSATSRFGYYTTTPTINYRGGNEGTNPPGAPAGWNPNGTGKAFDTHWEGVIQIPFEDDYTLYAGSDDGIQVTVDGVVLSAVASDGTIVNRLNADRGYTDEAQSPVLHFTAGQYVTVQVDFNQGGGGWDATFGAKGANGSNPLGTNEVIVPQSVVYIPTAKAVSNLTVAGKNGTAILSWNRSNVETDTYNIYQSPTGAPGTFTLAGTAPGSAGTFSKTGLTNGTTYYYMVTAVNPSGESPLSSVVSTTPVLAAPDAPLNVAAKATIALNAPTATPTVSWSAQLFTDTYSVYRSNSATGTFALIKSGITGTSFVDTDPTLAFGNTYFYKVSGTNTIGEGAQSGAVSAAYTSGAELHAYNNQWWKSPTQNTNGYQNIGGTADYAEVRPTIDFDNPPASNIGPNNYSEVATGKIHVNVAGTYTFVNATDDDGYLFVNGQLVASDPGGHGVQNAFLGGTAGSPVPLTLAVGDYDFQQFMSQGGGGSGIHFRMVDPASTTGGIIAVPAFGAAGAAVTYGNSIVSSLPAKPTNLEISPGGTTDISLNFSDNSTSELHYLIQRATSQAGPYKTVATLGLHDNGTGPTVNFIDPALQPATTYWYRVVGTNYDGIGTPSDPISITTGTTVAQGLEGHYYGNFNYSLPGISTLTADVNRVDPQVAFPGGQGLPAGFTTNFSTRWTGKVLADTAGLYTFTLNTDDGSRLFIDGKKVVDSYFDKGESLVTGTPVQLSAGYHDIVMEFYQIGGGYGAQLLWNPADPSTGLPVGGAPSLIPSDHLQAISSLPANPTALTFPATGSSTITVQFTDNAKNEIGYSVERSTDPTFAAGSTSMVGFIPFNTTQATGTVSFTDKSVTPGAHYYYRVQALNYDGASSYVSGDVVAPAAATGGAISGTVVSPGGSVIDLTANGTLDWVHYGLNTTDGYDHKVGATVRISDATLLGTNYRHRFNNNPTSFQWTDGTPTLSAKTNDGIYTDGQNNGFEITVPATTTDRTLKVFVGLNSAKGALTATLSDGSAATFSDASIVNAGGTSVAVYTITYHAASANQQLTVDWVNTNNGGNVTLEGATLSLPGEIIAPTITRVLQSDSSVLVNFVSNITTQTGFEIQRSADGGATWTTIGTAGAGAQNFIDKATGLTQYATYSYRARALGSPAPSAYGSPASIVYLPAVTPGQHANGFAAPVYPAVTLTGPVAEGGFENPSEGPGTFTYNPTGGAWTFNGTSGILNPFSAFGEQAAPEGTQVAFLQNNSGDSRNDPSNGQYIGQTVTFTAGTYVFSDIDAGRPGNTQASYKVVLDQGTANEKVIFTNSPIGSAWTQHVSAPFTVTAGAHTLRLVATGPTGADNTSFIDAVRIVPQASYAPLATPFQDLQLNGSVSYVPPTSVDPTTGYLGRLRLTRATNGQTGSAFERVAAGALVGGFTTTFDYQISQPSGSAADGAAFVIQSVGPTALGGGGGAFGYDGIGNSLAIYLNQYNGVTQTGIGINGVRQAALDMSPQLGNAFHAYNQNVDGNSATDVFKITLTYDPTTKTLHETVVDTQANKTYTNDFTGIDLKSILGNSGAAYTGFTGATGGENSTQDIIDWTLTPTSNTPIVINSAAGTPLAVNDGSVQRSEVRSFTMTFDRAVVLGPGSVTAVRLNTGGSGLNDGSAPTDVSAALGTPVSNDGGFTWIIPVLPNVAGLTDATGSLTDGVYTLTAHASAITDTANHAVAGADLTQTTHRLFGDANGNKTINNADYGPFRNAFGSSIGQAGYVSYFDFDNNGVINNADYGQFRNRFGKTFA